VPKRKEEKKIVQRGNQTGRNGGWRRSKIKKVEYINKPRSENRKEVFAI
jgi:hypothetical protein